MKMLNNLDVADAIGKLGQAVDPGAAWKIVSWYPNNLKVTNGKVVLTVKIEEWVPRESDEKQQSA